MASISGNAEINSIRLREQAAAPATPAVGYVQVYARADGKLYIRDDAGVETTLAATLATDALWDQAGDLVRATGADTAERLAIGALNNVLTAANGAPFLAAPAAPTLATATTGGTVADGTYTIGISYVNAQGETVESATATITTAGGGTSTITITSPAAAGSGNQAATGWYAYVSQAGGTARTRQQAAGSPTAIGTNVVLTAPPTASGAAPPASNTAGTRLPRWSTGGGTARGFQAKLGAVQSIANGVYTKVQMSTELFDTASKYDNVTNYRWTPPAGLVMISLSVEFASQTSGGVFAALYKNGLMFQWGGDRENANNGNNTQHVIAVDNASGTDYYEAYAVQFSGGAMDLNTNNLGTSFSGISYG